MDNNNLFLDLLGHPKHDKLLGNRTEMVQKLVFLHLILIL